MSPAQRFGKYSLLRKIATGGMAEVFLARAEGAAGFQKLLVVKRILPNLAEDQQFVSMFLNEARVASQLNHPNIVSIYELGEADGSYYIAMEHIDGPNLRGLCRRAAEGDAPIAPALAVKMISLAAEGLHYAHDAVGFDGEPLGLIHRDISPDNILLSRQGTVKVVDFGIVKAANQPHLTKSGILKGKIAYMPPEQIRGHAVDRRADVFALGVCLYELIAGTRPFDSTSEVAMMQAILNDPPAPLQPLRPDVDPELEVILLKALEKDREKRYATCQAFQIDLERYLMTKGVAPGARDLATLVERLLGPPVPLQLTPPPAPRPISNPVLHEAGEISFSGKQRDPRSVGPQVTGDDLTGFDLNAIPESPPRRSGVFGGLAALVAVGGVGLGAYYLGNRSAAPALAPVLVQATLAPHAPAPAAKPASATPPPGGASAPPPALAVAARPSPSELVTPPPTGSKPAPGAAPSGVQETALSETRHPSGSPHHLHHSESSLVATAASHPAPVAAPAVAQLGQVEFRVLPWANVEIDHRPFGQTPLAAVSLDVGQHHVVLTNSELHARQELDITIVAGQTYVVKKRMGEP